MNNTHINNPRNNFISKSDQFNGRGSCCPSASSSQAPSQEFNQAENYRNNLVHEICPEKNKINNIKKNTSNELKVDSAINKINGLKKNEHISQSQIPSNNDYLTMKPIHRAKPFITQALNKNDHRSSDNNLSVSRKFTFKN